MIAAHNFYENKYARFRIVEGILFFEYKAQLTIDLEVAQCVVHDRIHFQKERAFPVLCDARGVLATEKAARDYLAQSGSVLVKAVALLVYAKVLLTMSCFYTQISKPTIPTQVFTKEADALVYLKGFV
jgi:hypothetical protein